MDIPDHEVLADELDRAAHISEMMNQNLVQEIRRAAEPEQTCIDGVWETMDCVDCGEPIEEGRLLLGKVRCYQCQSKLENREKRGL